MDEQPNLPTITQPSATECSAQLYRCLTEIPDGGQAIRLIAKTPALRAEVQQMLPVLCEQMHEGPAVPTTLHVELVRHALTLGVADRTDGEWIDLLSIYAKALEKFSFGAIQGAFVRWNRCELYPNEPGRHGFFPKPAEIHALAQKHMNEIGMAYWRAKKALEFVEEKGIEWTAERRREERQKAIEAGYLKPDGSLNVEFTMRKIPGENRPQQTPHQMADALRSRPVDDVI